jgi:hypothetical protein
LDIKKLLKTNVMAQFYKLKSRLFILALLVSGAGALLSSCKDDDDDDGASVVKEKTVQMETTQEIPTVPNRTEKGTAEIKLFSDSTLQFNISVSNLDGTDQLTLAHIHTGGPVDVGAPLVVLVDNSTTKFQGSGASGKVKLNSSQFYALKNGDEFYVNVHSTKFPVGLLRGQMDKTITFAQNLDLTPISNPLRPETGTAILRMGKDSTLFYKVTVNNLTAGDALTNAQINVGASGVTGPAVINLYTMASDFDTPKSMKLTGSQVEFLTKSQVYLMVNSQQVTNELLRGQLR